MGTPRFRSTVDRSRKSKVETSGRKVDIKALRADVEALHAELAAAVGCTVRENMKQLKARGGLSDKALEKLAKGDQNPKLATLAWLAVMLERPVLDILRTDAATAFRGRLTLEAERLKVPDAHHVWSAVMDEVITRSPDRLVKFIANPELRLHWIEVRTVDASRMEYEWTFKVPEHETTPLRFRARVTSKSSDGILTFTIKGGDTDGSPRPRIAKVWGQWQLVPTGRVFQVSFGFVVAIELGDNAAFNATVRRYMRDLDNYMKQLRRLLELAISDYDIILR